MCLGETDDKRISFKKRLYARTIGRNIKLSTRQLQRIEKNEEKTTIQTLKKIRQVLEIPDEDMVQIFYSDKEKEKIPLEL